MNKPRRTAGQIWRWPIMLAALTLFGLLSALLGQGGIWWLLSWIALAVPLITITILYQGRQKRSDALPHEAIKMRPSP
jgi:low affinity Fe/Cu permease